MSTNANERFLVSFLKDYCTKHGLKLNSMCDGWFFELKNGAASHLVFGYDLGLNPSSTHQVCRDKAATFELLRNNEVAAVFHRVFFHPNHPGYDRTRGNWRELLQLMSQFGNDVVLKPNEGTAGRDVVRVQDPESLERTFQSLSAVHESVAVSPYLEIVDEIRVYMLDDQAMFMAKKNRPSVTGDGLKTITELAEDQHGPELVRNLISRSKDSLMAEHPNQILPAGEIVDLTWKHNLGLGAQPIVVAMTDFPEEVALSQNAAKALNLKIGSVDIVRCTDGSLHVLEVNSGMMLERLSKSGAKGLMLAHGIYDRAMRMILEHSKPDDLSVNLIMSEAS